jgi:hypothetical protein
VISLGDIISRSANDSNAVVNPVISALTTVFNRIFGAGTANVSVTATQLSDASYSLTISVAITYNNEVYGIASTVQVNNGVLVLVNDTVPPPTS